MSSGSDLPACPPAGAGWFNGSMVQLQACRRVARRPERGAQGGRRRHRIGVEREKLLVIVEYSKDH